jgi:hypothetical protein
LQRSDPRQQNSERHADQYRQPRRDKHEEDVLASKDKQLGPVGLKELKKISHLCPESPLFDLTAF